jgi:hypothetical protein
MKPIGQAAEALHLARGQAGLLSTSQCVVLGLSTQRITNLVRTGLWRRITRSVYDTGYIDPDVNPLDWARIQSAWIGMLGVGPEAIAVGLCALALHGVWGLPQRIVPEVALPAGRFARGPQAIRVRRFSSTLGTINLAGRLIADVPTALVQALPELDRDTAVAVLDSALNRGQLTDGSLSVVRERVRGRRGAARLHEWWPLVDRRAESPVETHARLDCHDAGIAPDALQVILRNRHGTFLARGDLGWIRADGSWVLVEIDGKTVHAQPDALYGDRTRQNRIAIGRKGTTLLRYTAVDVYRKGCIPAEVRMALDPT